VVVVWLVQNECGHWAILQSWELIILKK